MYLKNISIVIVDDDTIIRNALKMLIWSSLRNKFFNIKLYSSSDGVDGLGLIHASNPDVIIIDSTLPRYSGLEIVNSLSDIPEINKKHVVIIHDASLDIGNIPQGYKLISKKSNKFVYELNKYLYKVLFKDKNNYPELKTSLKSSLVRLLIGQVIRFANLGDLLMARIVRASIFIKIPLYLYWGLIQFISSFYYAILIFLSPKVVDSNLKQGVEDFKLFRVKAYPSLIALFTLIIFLFFQTIILFTGGIILFNTIKIESIFAATNNSFTFDLNNSEFDQTKIEYNNGVLQLKEIVVTQEVQETLPEDDINNPTENKQSVSQIETYYSSDNPAITFKESVSFGKLSAIYEVSNLNTLKESSLQEPIIGVNKITYQLSPDNNSWFYFGSESVWEKTQNGFESSNTIQEVNKYLADYQQQIGGNELYLRIYFHSDGGFQIQLNSIEVERELPIISTISEYQEPVNSPIVKEDTVLSYSQIFTEKLASYADSEIDISKVNKDIPVPTLFSASYFDGNKIIFGKVLTKEINPEELNKYRVEAYYTQSTDIKFLSNNILEFIGESDLTINERGDIIFKIEAVGNAGGFVTTRLVYITESGEEIYSLLSKPLES